MRYHGDFDIGGLRIAEYLRQRYDIVLWRIGVDDYRESLAREGKVLFEEQVLEALLDDLCQASVAN